MPRKTAPSMSQKDNDRGIGVPSGVTAVAEGDEDRDTVGSETSRVWVSGPVAELISTSTCASRAVAGGSVVSRLSRVRYA